MVQESATPALEGEATIPHPSSILTTRVRTNYLKLRSLGEGSYGKVLLVENTQSQRLFAMKVQRGHERFCGPLLGSCGPSCLLVDLG